MMTLGFIIDISWIKKALLHNLGKGERMVQQRFMSNSTIFGKLDYIPIGRISQ